MTLLLDTHTVLWFWWDDPQLSTTARSLPVNALTRRLTTTTSSSCGASAGWICVADAASNMPVPPAAFTAPNVRLRVDTSGNPSRKATRT